MKNIKKFIFIGFLLSNINQIFTKEIKGKNIKALSKKSKSLDNNNKNIVNKEILRRIAVYFLELLKKEITNENVSEIIQVLENLIKDFNLMAKESAKQITENFKQDILHVPKEELNKIKEDIKKTTNGNLESYAVTFLGGKDSFNESSIAQITLENYSKILTEIFNLQPDKLQEIIDSAQIPNKILFSIIMEIKNNILEEKISKEQSEELISKIIEEISRMLTTDDLIKLIVENQLIRKAAFIKALK